MSLAITGTDQLYAVDAPFMQPHPVRIVLGEPVEVVGRDAAGALEAAWRSVARDLPAHQRPTEDTPAVA